MNLALRHCVVRVHEQEVYPSTADPSPSESCAPTFAHGALHLPLRPSVELGVPAFVGMGCSSYGIGSVYCLDKGSWVVVHE